MTYNLIKETDKHVCRSRFYLPRGRHFYPSEASARWTDHHGIPRVAGHCNRASWYRLNSAQAGGTDPYSQWIFSLGRAVEDILVEEWKQMGIWVANNVKFYDEERNISGEVDVILREPDGTLFCVEVKSFYGYHATRDIMGNKSVPGRPKTSQLLQALIYTDLGRRLGLFDYTKMVYFARDSAKRREFDITLTEEGGQLRPTIDGGIDFRFTMQDIYNRYEELAQSVMDGEVPPRDYEKEWDRQKVELRKEIGEVSKSAYEKWKKKPALNPIGDWQCRYCEYSELCWSDS